LYPNSTIGTPPGPVCPSF